MKTGILVAAALALTATNAQASTTVAGSNSEGSTTDPFNGAIVDSSSPIVPAFSAADAFGAVTSSPPYDESIAGGHVIFANAGDAFINFHTAAPVTISGFNIFASSDGFGNAFRGFDTVSLYASGDGGASFGDLLGTANYDPNLGGVEISGSFAPVTAQYFRFQGVGADGGPRLIEIDGTAAVPEPATWAMMLVGFGAMGASLRYRRRRSSVSYA